MQDFNMLLEPVRGLLQAIGEFLPRLLLSVGVLIVGWLVAKAFRFAVVRALRALNFHVLTERAGVDRFLQQGGTDHDTSDIVGAIGYGLVILGALVIAFNGLGLTQVTELLTRVMLFLPRVLVALLLLVFGAYFGGFLGNAVRTYCANVGIADAEILGRVVQYLIVAFVVLLAIDHLEIGGGLIQQTFLILLAGVVFAGALALGLGARERAALMIERWFPRDEPSEKSK
jgi:Mechanosensitive ion channel, conserved TM helix